MNQPSQYRKKPVVIEAMGPLTHDNAASIAHWCGGGVNRALDALAIDTLEGTMRAEVDRLRGLLARALPWIDPNDRHEDYLLTVEIREALGEPT